MKRLMHWWAPIAIGAGLLALVAACSDENSAPGLRVGAAKRDITPTTTTAPPDGSVYLGGYGFGPERPSTGVIEPIFVRAFVVSGPEGTVAFAQNETQGAPAAHKDGPYGLIDVGEAVEAATAGAIPRSHVVVGSDHSHAGPDTTGVWGGLPESYLTFLRDQTVAAIVDAYESRQQADLWTGAIDATDLIRSQFDEPPNVVVDGELRVLVATEPGDASKPLAALINYAAHATVMGSGNTLISGDWPSVVSDGVERTLGVDTAVVMVADVGRTQPQRDLGGGDTDEERLRSYGALVEERALLAIADLEPVEGDEVAATQRFLREPYSNPLSPIALLAGIISRSDAAPWLSEETIGTVVSAARVGNVLFAAVPGEGYPAIQLAMVERVDASQHFLFGLANDQLGYLIAPEEGYPDILAAAPDNDNAVFNVSPKIGDHVQCALLAAAEEIGFVVTPDDARCAQYADEDPQVPGSPLAH
jgi:hypothetical protein